MSEDIASKGVEVITLPDGSICCGDVIHEPWPSLRTLPHRGLGFHDEIVRATPGSPFYEFTSRIPTEIRELVRAAPNYPWALLELCAANPGRGVDLLKNCPALAILVVQKFSPTDQGDRRDYFRTMLALPWRDLLRELRLPPRERTMRILGKVPLAHSYKQVLGKLRDVLGTPGHPWVHVLPHLPRITRDTISILSSDSKIINAALLRASAETSFDEETVHWLIGSVRALLIENGREGDWPYRNATFAQLKIAEGRLHERIFLASLVPFPPPPFRVLPREIEPLRDFEHLMLEGTYQKNCATTYIPEIGRGVAYLYSVHSPERATAALRRDTPDGEWYLHDLRALNNSEVSAETNTHVYEWLRNQLPGHDNKKITDQSEKLKTSATNPTP